MMTKISQGRRGEVFLINSGDEKIILKRALQEDKKASINKEIMLLQKLGNQGIDFVPKLLEYGDGWFKMNFIEGKSFSKTFGFFLEKRSLVESMLRKCRSLDVVGVVHGELARPGANVLLDGYGNISIIDFERGWLGDFSAKNMKAFSQWLSANRFIDIDIVKSIDLVNGEKTENFVEKKGKNYNNQELESIYLYIVDNLKL